MFGPILIQLQDTRTITTTVQHIATSTVNIIVLFSLLPLLIQNKFDPSRANIANSIQWLEKK